MAAFAEYQDYDGLGLAQLMARGEVTAEEVLEAASASIEERNPAVNAICLRLDEQAGAALAAGLPDGPFKGVPILIKDLNAPVAGTVLSNGSRFFADQHSDHDSELVARYRRAGLVICGKSSTPEFGINCSTEPTLFGATRNPWNLDHTAGGSSGGAAAAVASGMVPLAHASDGGGSIRIPASCCGLFGLKPTLAKPPLAIGELTTETDDVAAYRERLFGFSPFTSLFNVSGQPACTVPLHWSEAGLPIGSHLAAAYGNEALLFRLAAQLEAARPWFKRRPS